jgi:hypothetical protein
MTERTTVSKLHEQLSQLIGSHDCVVLHGSPQIVLAYVHAIDAIDRFVHGEAAPLVRDPRDRSMASGRPVIRSVQRLRRDGSLWRVELDSGVVDLALEEFVKYKAFNDQCARQLGRQFDPMPRAEWRRVTTEVLRDVVIAEAQQSGWPPPPKRTEE